MPEKIKFKKERAKLLAGLIEDISDNDNKNLISHNFIEGKTLYEVDDSKVFEKFLTWLDENLFKKTHDPYPSFYDNCNSFYKEKTNKRIQSFFAKNKKYDALLTINTIPIGSVRRILENQNWKDISEKSICSSFHGDLNFGNAIYTEKKSFKLIDWRSDFEGNMLGDMYYDLGKLYAGILVNFSLANNEETPFSCEDNNYTIKNFQTNNDIAFLEIYDQWINKKYDLNHIKKIAALSYLNMSPLHPGKFGEYLFLKGALELFKVDHDIA